MYGAVRLSAIVGVTPFFAKGVHGIYHFNTESEQYKTQKKQTMTMQSCSEYKDGKNIETTPVNKYVMNSGLKDIVKVSKHTILI